MPMKVKRGILVLKENKQTRKREGRKEGRKQNVKVNGPKRQNNDWILVTYFILYIEVGSLTNQHCAEVSVSIRSRCVQGGMPLVVFHMEQHGSFVDQATHHFNMPLPRSDVQWRQTLRYRRRQKVWEWLQEIREMRAYGLHSSRFLPFLSLPCPCPCPCPCPFLSFIFPSFLFFLFPCYYVFVPHCI